MALKNKQTTGAGFERLFQVQTRCSTEIKIKSSLESILVANMDIE